MKKTIVLASASLLFVNLTKAQDTTKVVAKEEAKPSPFTFSGYIDSYYNYNLNNPQSGSNLGASGTARAFDQRSNTLGLGLIQTKFGYTNKRSDVVVDLTFGPNADLGNYGNNPFLSWNPTTVGAPVTSGPLGVTAGTNPVTKGGAGLFLGSIAVKQAYWNFKATDKLTFTAGQFGTHIGYEVIDAPINYNYSLSNLFNNGPFYHIGVKANYAFSDRFALMGGVVNNVDALYDNNRAKAIIGQMFIKPAEGWNVYINYIGSNEANPSPTTGKDTTGFYQLLDLTTGYQITKKFYLGLNAAYGSQKGDYQGTLGGLPVGTQKLDSTRHWGGVALYSNFQFNDYFGIGGRAEYFDNSAGVRSLINNNALAAGVSTTGGTSVWDYTLTGKITLDGGHLILKPEVRMDVFKKFKNPGTTDATDIQQFQDSNGHWTKNSQTTVGLAMIYTY